MVCFLLQSEVFLLGVSKLTDENFKGVSAPIVGTTSLDNLYDLLGMVLFKFFFLTRLLGGY